MSCPLTGPRAWNTNLKRRARLSSRNIYGRRIGDRHVFPRAAIEVSRSIPTLGDPGGRLRDGRARRNLTLAHGWRDQTSGSNEPEHAAQQSREPRGSRAGHRSEEHTSEL